MMIKVEISAEVQAEMERQAAARGVKVPAYVATLIESVAQRKAPVGRHAGRESLAQLFAESPFKGLDIDFERDADLGRDIEL